MRLVSGLDEAAAVRPRALTVNLDDPVDFCKTVHTVGVHTSQLRSHEILLPACQAVLDLLVNTVWFRFTTFLSTSFFFSARNFLLYLIYLSSIQYRLAICTPDVRSTEIPLPTGAAATAEAAMSTTRTKFKNPLRRPSGGRTLFRWAKGPQWVEDASPQPPGTMTVGSAVSPL